MADGNNRDFNTARTDEDRSSSADQPMPQQTPHEDGSYSPSPSYAQSNPQPYVRQRPAHRTMEPIDDYAQDDTIDSRVAHDSDYTVRGNVVSGRSYRRSRNESEQLRRDLHYGQYLEVPKGRRDIFVSREKKARNRTIIAVIAVLAVLALAFYLVWDILSDTWFAIS